jgi:hypothetical protein
MSHFGVGKGSPWYLVSDAFRGTREKGIASSDESLPAGVVRELETTQAVSGSIDMGLTGTEAPIHLNTLFTILYPSLIHIETIYVRTPSNRNQHSITDYLCARRGQVYVTPCLPSAFHVTFKSQVNSFITEDFG